MNAYEIFAFIIIFLYIAFTIICLVFNGLAFKNKVVHEIYDKYLNNWKLLPISSISIDYDLLNKSLNSKKITREINILKLRRVNKKYDYKYLFFNDNKNNHVCGIDDIGNFLYLPNDMDCPINYIEINNAIYPEVKTFNYTTLKISDNIYLHYSNNNIFGTLYNNIQLIIKESNKYFENPDEISNNLTLSLYEDSYFSNNYLSRGENFYFKIAFNLKEIRIAINSITLVLLVLETIFLIIRKHYLYTLNIFIFIIQIILESFLYKLSKNEFLNQFEEELYEKKQKTNYNLLLLIFYFLLFLDYLIFLSIDEPTETNPYILIIRSILYIFYCPKFDNIDKKIDELDKEINKLNNDISRYQQTEKDLSNKNNEILEDIK